MIKKFSVVCALLLCAAASAFAQPAIKAQYLEETELVCVVAHLAEVPGYTWEEDEQGVTDYFEDVDRYFKPYLKHNIFSFVSDKLVPNGFAWHFPMHLALRLHIQDGKIIYTDELVRDYDGYYESISRKNEKKFLKLLADFYKESNFHEFYLQHRPLYDDCEAAMQKVLDKIDFGWYDRFFGPVEGNSFSVHMGLLCGAGNYAINQRGKDGSNKVKCVIGCCDRDSQGTIYYATDYTLPIIIHECNHSYCNPLDDEIWEQIKDKELAFFKRNAEHYKSIAYGSPVSVANETFVEACVMRYLFSHPIDFDDFRVPQLRKYFDKPDATEAELSAIYVERLIDIDYDYKKFYMIRDIIKCLEEREANPELYPTMRSFLPRYIATINSFPLSD